MSLLGQLPRLSAYDPGAEGEGGLDPLGLSAIADRIADVLAPGVRARMSQPRFVTTSAVGAIAYQALHERTADLGSTTVDIAFEWLVVEALVRHGGKRGIDGLPGNQKAARAAAVGERLCRRNYLSGPKVFGFTGVYRPFSRDVGVLGAENLPAESAARLLHAWEQDFQLEGYVGGVPGSRGGKLRKEIAEACERTLEKGECASPPTGQLMRDLAGYLTPPGAKSNERIALRALITGGGHEIRNELTGKLVASPPPDDVTQRELALQLVAHASAPTRKALQASIDFEEMATALDNTFRRFLAHTTQQHGSVISRPNAVHTPGVVELVPRMSDLVRRAVDSVAELDDENLTYETANAGRLFARQLSSSEFLDALIERHEEVQAKKKKLPWLDQLGNDWAVRTPYRNQGLDLKDDVWTHPMRLVTLARLLAETT